MKLDNELSSIFKRLKEVHLLDESRDEAYDNGTYAWDTFMTDADYSTIEEVIDEAIELAKDHVFDEEDTDAELQFLGDTVQKNLQFRGFIVVDLPYIETHTIVE